MKALIDADVLLYRLGFKTEELPVEEAIDGLVEYVHSIADAVDATEVVLYLSCSRAENFRTKINPEYKGNRSSEKPKHFLAMRDFMVEHMNAVEGISEEADDLIGIAQAQDPENTVGCSNDKDILYGVVGHKYNFVKQEKFYTTSEDALLFFYRQLLVGDDVDNIKGIKGVAMKTAEKILPSLLEEDLMFDIVVSEYAKRSPHTTLEQITAIGQQLKIRAFKGEIWQPPNGVQDDFVPS